jgi:hypothetical protein
MISLKMNYYVYGHHNFWQWRPSNSELVYSNIVFLWNDFCFRDSVKALQELGKKVIVYEHGLGALFDYELDNKEFLANGYLALGRASKDSLIRAGVDKDKILITGNPIYDDIKKAKKKSGKNALFVALHWFRDMSEYNQIVFDQLVKAYPDFEWTVKLVDKTGDVVTDKKKWFNKVESENLLQDIKKRLPEYDMVFTPKFSTFESFAVLMGTPVYVVDEQETFWQEGDPVARPFDNTYLKIGEKLPEQKPIDMSKYIERPSLDFDLILDWCKNL